MKNFIVIGGSSGIGKAISLQLKQEGHKVYATYHTNASTEAGISFEKLNVLDENLDLSFLPDQIDGIAYCPGAINLKPFHRFKAQDFLDDFKLQVVGAVKVIQELLPKLKKSENASIVLFSSVAVQLGFGFHATVAASKGALEGLTRSLAAELAPKIRVNAIAPSLTQTPLAQKLISTEEKIQANADRHPLKRIGTPADIAEIACFLLGDKSSWISGQVLGVDGGKSAISS